jgi:hypothetical protein
MTYKLGYKKESGSLIEIDCKTLGEAFKEGVSTLLFNLNHTIEIEIKDGEALFFGEINGNKEFGYVPLNIGSINEFFGELLYADPEDTFKFMTLKEKDYDICFEVLNTEDYGPEYDPVVVSQNGLAKSFCYALSCIYPDIEFEAFIENNRLKIVLNNNQGEFSIAYDLNVTNFFFADVLKNNKGKICNMHIFDVEAEQEQFEAIRKEKNKVVFSEDSDIPF